MTTITAVRTHDARYTLKPGEGVDAVHSNPQYAYAVTLLDTDSEDRGVGLAFTLGGGNPIVCQVIDMLAQPLVGREIEDLMADFASVSRAMADHAQLRWLGPHKGVVHLALSSIVNACFDVWAKSRGVPLWKLLLDLPSEAIVNTLDLSYLDEVLTREQAIALLEAARSTRSDREGVLVDGYPGYDTSIGWFHYSDDEIRDNAKRALGEGFTAMKLKVGSVDTSRDVRRAMLVRNTVGPDVRLMLDTNQQWTLPVAIKVCKELAAMDPFWVEEPTHPDDVIAHKTLADAIAPVPIALGEHVPNKVLFKNFIQAGCAKFIQVDAVRVAGISEFIAVSLMAKQAGLTVVPHVGDMGQIHQHMVLFNHIALDLPRLFLEYIPHLREYFVEPAHVADGVYRTPQSPGSSSDLIGVGS